jgi:HK97 family phage prohead protease
MNNQETQTAQERESPQKTRDPEAVIRTFVRTLERLGAERAAKGTPLEREVKFVAQPVAVVGETGVFEGYASLFEVADLGRDVVAPGAFAESLARRGAGGVRMLWQHDPAQPIGRWLSIAEDGRGLRVRGELNLAVARAREVHALLRDGAIDGLSIGFRVERSRPAAGLRHLEKLDLWEISVVTFPMHPGARVSGVKRNHLSPAGRGRPAEGAAGEGLAAAIRRARIRLFG